MSILTALNGRRGAKEIQQPAPVFFSPEQEKEMAVGYKRDTESDDARMRNEIRETIASIQRTRDRLKIVLEAREKELAETQKKLQTCVSELCSLCRERAGSWKCEACQWRTVKEMDA